MGLNIRLSCSGCKENSDYKIGQGLRDFDKEIIINQFSSKQSEVSKALEQASIYNFEKVVGYCQDCNTFGSFSKLTYFLDDEQLIILDTCECGNTPKIVFEAKDADNAQLKIDCPRCSDKLEIQILDYFD
ncbi:MAG: hypothetical protein Q4D29_03025 [Lachnospiraceae bacterium]|nr:hypothetical protein [Lachnospiraceae bacterium]